MGYRTTSGGVSNPNFHLVWCPQYRLIVLTEAVAENLDNLLREKAESLVVMVKDLFMQPDHVHLFVKATPAYSPAKLAREYKGYTSRVLRQYHKHLRTRLPTLWSWSNCIGSTGHVSDATITGRIEAHETR